MTEAQQDRTRALKAVRSAWPALAAMTLGVAALMADLAFARPAGFGLVAACLFLAGLAWWGTAAFRLHKAVRALERSNRR